MPAPSKPSPIQINHDGGLTLVLVRPALVTADWTTTEDAADQVIRELKPASPPRCVIDLSELDYLGSSQVAFIVRVWKSVRAADGQFAVACPQQVVAEVLQLAGLDKLLTIQPTRDAAVRSLARPDRTLTAAAQIGLGSIALIGGLAALVGLGLMWTDRIPGHVARIVEYSGAAIGFLSGSVVTAFGRGRGRRLGVVAVILTFVTLLASLWPQLRPPHP